MTEKDIKNSIRRWLAPPLIVFVLISIGFALGRLSESRVVDNADSTTSHHLSQQPSHQKQVLVRYFHGDMRCATCNKIEAMLQSCLQSHYAAALASEQLVISTVNFDVDETLAKRYNINTSIPLLSYRIADTEQAAHQLSAVWELYDHPDDFTRYIITELDAAFIDAGLDQFVAAQP